jgi:hypothetical protein
MKAKEIRLNQIIKQTYVLAYNENVAELTKALASEGLNPTIQCESYSEVELSYAKNTRTFINHHSAWRRAARHDGYTLICESDFVPCVGLGSFPVFWPLEDLLAWGYLYQGSPRLLALIGKPPYLRGHCAPLVAYVINSPVAKIFCEFFYNQMAQYDPQKYFTFDAHLQWFVMGRGANAFIPLKHYGEHGGLPNPEHRENKLPRAGRHRADNLAANLYFRPQYARNSWITFLAVRIQARALGLARLLSNRWVVETNVYNNGPMTKLKMYVIGLTRLLI